ncbi:MAG: Fe-S cluster assembly protein SufD [Candidatus Eisenbacteria bacterium]|uniref:Fe-S cluster assembly protein SufD n=1 Tax=Eiseniibacteriota bacterium TaxID=2212470 RepID=A0A538U8S4_UNCEI|nr:MAG: Fe-S cluster assembly protein SufD [Candidatus Eisenbacteria bacterium]
MTNATTTPKTTLRPIAPEAWETTARARAQQQGEPDWALEQRRIAAAQAKALGLPSREHELWRRIDFRTLEQGLAALDPFHAGPAAATFGDLPAGLQAVLGEDADRAGVLVQRDAGVAFERNAAELERQGVIVCSLERALTRHAELLRPRLGALIEPDYDGYAALGAAIRSGGAFVWVPDGVEAALPIRLLHGLDAAGRLAAPRSVIVLGQQARATIVEEQSSAAADGLAFHLGGTEVFLGEESKLVFATLQEWGGNVYHYSNQRARIERGAELQWIQTVLGGRMVKTNSYFDLAGPGASAYVHGFMFGDERQHFHLHTLQRHLADHCTSDLLIKGCLKDHARSVYQGLIQVAEGAQRTDAYQANRNLVLSDTARADSIPGLEILANDVRCTHGATIGSVDPEQMYYLMARGLPRNTAQRLIVEGFFTPVIDRIPLEGIREHLRQVIQRKIG